MFVRKTDTVNAREYDGPLIGREIMVAAAHHDWFRRVSEGSGLSVLEIFTVTSAKDGWLSFENDARIANPPHDGSHCTGCGEVFRFDVVGP